ncbi:glycine receptor subunit alpha-2-like isoform X2 [Portunus trituberculatus]|uniref:glycine receptor subunit alpha-2-like isoform X2 n=1 Tax=Portunus trituberculatus TaxID=210409 RepID=UPI001E1CB6DE|nr:glycine receptor subunit alpha-2-like isoform X2 [Portunus trituberculatus]
MCVPLLLLLLISIERAACERLGLSEVIPEHYDRLAPPKEDGKPTFVYFHVTIMSIDSISESAPDHSNNLEVYTDSTVASYDIGNSQSSGTFVADIFFAQSWRDHRLLLPSDMKKDYRLTLTLTCAMNFVVYPHDTQECKMQMESLSHTTEDLVFVWDEKIPLAVDEKIELPQQNIVGNETSDCTQMYTTGNFSCLEVVFKLKRRLGHYLFHTYIPTCLIVIMSWVSFWIRPEIAPARVTLGVTSLLTMSTQHARSQAALPPVSYIKAIDVFMSSCTVFVFLVLMEYAVISVIMGDESRLRKLRNCAKYGSAKINFTTVKERRAQAIKVDKVARYLFPTSFAVLNFIYWATFWQYL